MVREPRSGATLSGLESVMWRLGSEPGLSAAVGTVSLLERAPDLARLAARLDRAAEAVPRLRQRIVPSSLPGLAATWQDDPTFAIDHHLHAVDVTGTHSAEIDQILDGAARLVAGPFDPDRPLWEILVATGLPDGRAALVQRMHHAITDGEGGIRLSEQFVDATPDEALPTPDPFVGADAEPLTTTLGERVVLAASEGVGAAARAAVDATRWAVQGVADPDRFARAGAGVLDAAASLRRQLLVVDGPRSPLWAERSSSRRLVAATVPFAGMRAAATTLGVSVNVVFVTAVLRGAATYHRSLGSPVEELRVAVPVSTRAAGSAAGNSFTPLRVVLPTGSGSTARAHVREVADRLAVTTHEPATGLIGSLAGLTDAVPAAVLGAAVRRQAAATDLVASNLRAAPFPLYVAGARILAVHALGPLVGTPVNVTMMTCDGRADLGIHVDAEAVRDPELLRDAVVGGVGELAALA